MVGVMIECLDFAALHPALQLNRPRDGKRNAYYDKCARKPAQRDYRHQGNQNRMPACKPSIQMRCIWIAVCRGMAKSCHGMAGG